MSRITVRKSDAAQRICLANLHPENYLRSRSNLKFNRNDFDCLSNKFVSRLVVRAN